MEIGFGLGFRVSILTFRPGFDGLLFISLALAVAEAIVDFDHGRSMSISPSNLTGHHEKLWKRAGDPHANLECTRRTMVLKFTNPAAALCYDWNHRFLGAWRDQRF